MLEALNPRPYETKERTPFAVVRAIRATIVELSTTLHSEDLVMEAIAGTRLAHGSRSYIQTIASTGHSIFYHQLHALYDFGRSVVDAEHRETFCRRCGQILTELVFEENVYSLFQMAMARPGALGGTYVSLVEAMLHNYSGHRYLYSFDCRADGVTLEFTRRDPEQTCAHLEQFALDPVECFRNSFEVLAGALETFSDRVIENFDSAAVEIRLLAPNRGAIDLPIHEEASFAYEDLLRTLIEYTRKLQVRWQEAQREEQAEAQLLTQSPALLTTWNILRRASLSDEIILLLGESGTGKSYQARRIHEHSNRREGPFVEVCLPSIGSDNLILSDLFGHEKGAFTGADHPKPGLFSLADGGTIFLDEVGDASPELQAKLLRVLDNSTFKRLGGVEDIHVNVRVIAATNRDLFALKEQGKFREDLYYRLSVIEVKLPPLRECRADIARLAQFLLERASGESSLKILPDELAACLGGYDWPGNIRELDHALRYAMMICGGDVLTAEDFNEPLKSILLGQARSRIPLSPKATNRIPPLNGSHGPIIDIAALREHIRTTPAVSLQHGAAYECPAHVMYAQRVWLGVLIEECGGDLPLIGKYWDRSSEKTIRKLVREYGLEDELVLARNGR